LLSRKFLLSAFLVSLLVVAIPLPASASPVSTSPQGASFAAAGPQILERIPNVADRTSPARVKLLVRKLFYGLTQAYQRSTQQGLSFVKKNNYPRLFDTGSVSWQEAEAQYMEEGFYESVIPDLNTLVRDQGWKVPATNCSSAATRPLRGETFLVTVRSSGGYESTGETFSEESDVHVTILRNKAYFYIALCGVR